MLHDPLGVRPSHVSGCHGFFGPDYGTGDSYALNGIYRVLHLAAIGSRLSETQSRVGQREEAL